MKFFLIDYRYFFYQVVKKYPHGEFSGGELSVQWIFSAVNFPTMNFPSGRFSQRRIFLTASFPTANCPVANFPDSAQNRTRPPQLAYTYAQQVLVVSLMYMFIYAS